MVRYIVESLVQLQASRYESDSYHKTHFTIRYNRVYCIPFWPLTRSMYFVFFFQFKPFYLQVIHTFDFMARLCETVLPKIVHVKNRFLKW